MIEYYSQILHSEPAALIRINIDSEAGTGKSYLIAVLLTALCNITTAAVKSSSLIYTASTGVTVFRIRGQITYTLLYLLI